MVLHSPYPRKKMYMHIPIKNGKTRNNIKSESTTDLKGRTFKDFKFMRQISKLPDDRVLDIIDK